MNARLERLNAPEHFTVIPSDTGETPIKNPIKKMTRALAALLACGGAAFAQDANKTRDALEWTVALRGRMAQMTNPVVRVHGIANVARVVSPLDPVAASGLYREAIASLFNISSSAFSERGTTVLPVASFSGLWKFVVPAALKCDPGLASAAQNQKAQERLDAERAGANATLGRAYTMLNGPLDKTDMLDRAAQVAAGALEAGDPNTFDTALLSIMLSALSESAPELADDLFIRSLDFVMAAPVPSPDSLQDLARFLFTAPNLVDEADQDQPHQSFQAGGATVDDLTATRTSANPDNIQALIETTLKLLASPDAVNRNPAVAYALAYQLLPRSRDLMPDRVTELENAMAGLASANAAIASQVQSGLGAAQNPDPESGDPAIRNFWLTGQIQGALVARQFDRARQLLTKMDDPPVRGQIAALIGFHEAAHAVESKSDQALSMANLVKPGIKRSLLYIGMISAGANRDTTLGLLPLAAAHIKLLPAEQRVRLFSALAAGLVRSEPESAYGVLNQLIAAYEDVRVSPRRGWFDPASVRRNFSPKSDAATDSSLILPGNRGFYEAVQTPRGRRNFGLRVPGVSAFTLAAFLAAAGAHDPDRLTAALLGLRDETTQAAAWVNLAKIRLKAAAAKP